MRARRKLTKWFPAVVLALLPLMATALDYRSVAVSGAPMLAEPAAGLEEALAMPHEERVVEPETGALRRRPA